MPEPTGCKIGGLIVAGGMGTRMGGREKPLLHLGDVPIVELILRRVRPQVDAIAIDVRPSSRNRYERWRVQGIPILSDPYCGAIGPLGGIAAGLTWLPTIGDAFEWLATVPGDAPFLPRDLVARLKSLALPGNARPVVAVDRERIQNLCALWPARCLPRLNQGIQTGRWRSVGRALEDFDAIHCPIDAGDHSFTNINTEGDLAQAELLVHRRARTSNANEPR